MKDKNINHGFRNHSGSELPKDTQIKPIAKDLDVNLIYYITLKISSTANELSARTHIPIEKTISILSELYSIGLISSNYYKRCHVTKSSAKVYHEIRREGENE